MSPRHIPNLLCILRMVLVAPLLWLLATGEYFYALAVFLVAGFTDGLDGFLAKRYDWRSKLGGILDPLADKLLLVSSFVTLAWIGLVPMWLLVAVVARDLVIVAGALGYRMLVGDFEASPTRISKANSALQLLYVLCVVAGAAYGIPGDGVVRALGLAVLATTVASGLDYVVTWGRRALQARG